MFAYCKNSPINFVDFGGDILQSFVDDGNDINDFFDDVLGGAGSGGSGSYHYKVDLSIAGRSSLQSGGLLRCGYTAYHYTTPTYGKGGQSKNLARVGRWMSATEYQKMVETNTVQMSPNGNTTYVASPANKDAFGKQASPGSYYVEFSVPKESIYPAGNYGWAQIPGPGSLYDRLDRHKGGAGITAMPIAYDIKIGGKK